MVFNSSTITSNSTQELQNLMSKAALLHHKHEKEFDASFTSMLLAFLISDDPISSWFQSFIQNENIDKQMMLKNLQLDQEQFDIIAKETSRSDISEKFTSSASDLITTAQKFREFIIPSNKADELLDVRHLMGAYIYEPGSHEKQLTKWGYDRKKWSNSFLGQIQIHNPDELENWINLHKEKFEVEPSIIVGPSAHIAHDRATDEDSLGYWAYAYAIFRFMTHEPTKAPLTISIQAPWGGGKTSLMRMIRKELDPEVFKDGSKEVEKSYGAINIRRVLKELKNWQKSEVKPLPSLKIPSEDQENDKKRKFTIWFEPWKYQSTKQIWAGLADSIMNQIADRLPWEERELFWFRLNYKRVNFNKIRMTFYENVINFTLKKIAPLLIAVLGLGIGFLFTGLIGIDKNIPWLQNSGWIGTVSAVLVSAVIFLQKFFMERSSANKEPAVISLKEYLDIPDYSKEFGFIHQVEADLRRIFDNIPEKLKPVVIFTDDLDRCSPETIADVMAGINLFLAGDFPCIFIFGMDTEMVAAALETAHAKVIANLPEEATSPLGWRFMEKFVQLPFIIPPPTESETNQYITSLLSSEEERLNSQKSGEVKTPAKKPTPGPTEITPRPQPTVQEIRQKKTREMDSKIESFSDTDPKIISIIEEATSALRHNPRETKRFTNVFRFNYFLGSSWSKMDITQEHILNQVKRWVIFSLKWPEVLRYIRRGRGQEITTEKGDSRETLSRLKLLEEIGGQSEDLSHWKELARLNLDLTPEKAPWLNDKELHSFFYREYHECPLEQRLSSSEGKGLW